MILPFSLRFPVQLVQCFAEAFCLLFRVYKNGQPINPLQMEAPPSLPVKPELRDSFAIVKQTVLAELDSMRVKNNL